MKNFKFYNENIAKLLRRGAALLVAGATVVSLAGCGKKKDEVSSLNSKSFEYSYYDQKALSLIPYQLKGIRQEFNEDNSEIGKEKLLEEKYVFDKKSYYDYVIGQSQKLYLLGHNEAVDGAFKDMWDDFKNPERMLMSTAFLKREFADVFPDPERYASYFYYIGNSRIFDISVDYQVLRSDNHEYYLLKTYSLTLKKQPQGIKATWPVGESFKYTVFSKINMIYGDGLKPAFTGYSVIGEKYEGIGSDTAEFQPGAVNLDDVLTPVEPGMSLTLTKSE